MKTQAQAPSNRTREDSQELFAEFFNGQGNFMTPNPIRYGWRAKGHYAYELSSGFGFTRKKVYGVSVLDVDPASEIEVKRSSLSHCYLSLEDAEEAIAELTYDVWLETDLESRLKTF